MSKKKLAGILGGCIVVVIVIVAIATLSPKPPDQVTDYSTLLHYLRDSGASIGEEGEIHEPFFDVEGRRVTVNGGAIQVFEYANAEVMESEASCVSPDGFSITKEKGDLWERCFVSWIGPPHFYKAGRIIVIYIGDDDSIISLLENALGTQFAGW
jgi:hypothetical protein